MKWLRQRTHPLFFLILGSAAGAGLGGMLHAQPAGKQAVVARSETVTLLAHPELGGAALGGGTYKLGEIVEILAIPAPHYRFVRWEGQVVNPASSRTRAMALANGIPITAVFEPERYQLRVVCEPAYTGQVEGGGWLPYGVTAPVRAVPAKGYAFSHWEGPVGNAYADDTVLANPLTGPVKLKAHFQRVADDCTLTVIAEPALGGEVTAGGVYEPGTVVKLMAKPAHGFVFNGWRGAVSSPGSAETEILVTRDMNVKAMFISQKTLIHAKIIPEGAGKVSGDLGVRPCFVPALLKAEALPGYVFDGWEGEVSAVSSDQASVTPKEAGKVIVVTARFRSLL